MSDSEGKQGDTAQCGKEDDAWQKCLCVLREALGGRALPYRTVWVNAFKRARVPTVDLPRSRRPASAHSELQVAAIEHCLADERRWAMAELITYTGSIRRSGMPDIAKNADPPISTPSIKS
ncbi:Uncharacterized protein GBIM_12346 [Gryllus bimaculatus]|nr:Uncharacterized protein GBIM_12346 [Gryllus bimaculatus]